MATIDGRGVWIRRLIHAGVIPSMKLLGIVGRTRQRTPDGREESLWEVLPSYEDAWGGEVHCFEQNIPSTVQVPAAQEESKFPVFCDSNLKARFRDLAEAVVGRIEAAESIEVAVEQ